MRAPPHTRGSTPIPPARLAALAGSPAHAGIDPPRASAPRTRPGLPRTRGDRPSRSHFASSASRAPPHTRGSTQHAIDAQWLVDGSPAHAGIDPPRRSWARSSRRLPRTRGDRPAPASTWATLRSAPPHTRGSTHRGQPRGADQLGSPAHAGIDPRPRSTTAASTRLPRTRGDRPTSPRVDSSRRPAPPHTRGSTLRLGGVRLARGGSPAHAGIDPPSMTGAAASLGLPRTRGDRPSSLISDLPGLGAPPHTRGSTRFGGAPVARDRGSPAHAGIDPMAARWWRSPSGLPRTRGDRPETAMFARQLEEAPPHTRGSTQRGDQPGDLRGGSPAHAGIDPLARPGRLLQPRLPRTRGDRPFDALTFGCSE